VSILARQLAYEGKPISLEDRESEISKSMLEIVGRIESLVEEKRS